jgi:hypothetical protein
MWRDSIERAASAGFRAMQFNFVVSTNECAVNLWKRFGFEIVGTLPQVFPHPGQGFVDAFVMFRVLQIATAKAICAEKAKETQRTRRSYEPLCALRLFAHSALDVNVPLPES